MGNHAKETRSSHSILILATAASLVLVFLSFITAPRLQAQGGPVRPGTNGVGYPSCIYCPSPQYTDAALKAKFQGEVVLQDIIQPDGHATNIEVAKSPGLGLGAKAIEDVKTWRFKPAIGPDGGAVATITMIEVLFRLPGQRVSFSDQ